MGNLASAVDELLAADVGDLPDAVLAEEIRELRTAVNRIEAAYLDPVAILDRRGVGDAEHNGSTAGWLRAQCRLAPGRASRDVLLARASGQLPVTREALGAGTISVPHAELIASLRTDLPDGTVRGGPAATDPPPGAKHTTPGGSPTAAPRQSATGCCSAAATTTASTSTATPSSRSPTGTTPSTSAPGPTPAGPAHPTAPAPDRGRSRPGSRA